MQSEVSFLDTHFSEQLSNWGKGLRDCDGTPAAAGIRITPYGGTALAAPDTFDMIENLGSKSGVYFTGEHVQEVLNGARIYYPDGAEIDPVPGLPVNGWEFNESVEAFFPKLSHIDLQHSGS